MILDKDLIMLTQHKQHLKKIFLMKLFFLEVPDELPGNFNY